MRTPAATAGTLPRQASHPEANTDMKLTHAAHFSFAGAARLLRSGLALCASMVLALSGCGGGGGGTSGGTGGTVTPPTITSQPASVSVAPGSSASFTVVATGGGLAYQWQRSTNGGLSWSDIAGASAASYSIAAVDASMNGHQFHVVIQNPAGIVVSAAATLTVTGGSISAVTAVSAGGFHSLASRADGSVWAWGGNGDGQVGSGSVADGTPTPTRVVLAGGGALSDVQQVSAGIWHSLARRANGSVLAWGRNTLGQLGDGTAASRNQAVTVQDATGGAFGPVQDVSAGNDVSAAVKSDGSVWVWGFHVWLFTAATKNPVPLRDAAGNPVGGAAKVAVGNGYLLVLKTDGSVWTWGIPGVAGAAATIRAVPVETSPGVPLTGVTRVAAGWSHALALAAGDRVLSWSGSGAQPALGRTTSAGQAEVPGFVTDANATAVTGVIDVRAGYGFSVIQKADGSLWSFGSNSNALLGAGSANLFETFPIPVREPGATPLGSVTAVSIGYQHTLALRQGGAVWGWGVNANAQLAKPVGSPADYVVAQPILVMQ